MTEGVEAAELEDTAEIPAFRLEVARVGSGFTIARSRQTKGGGPGIMLEMDVAESVKSALPKIEKMLRRML